MATSEPRWHPEAIGDAEGARNWYAERSPLAARAFLLALQEALVAVVDAPERWPLGRHVSDDTFFQRVIRTRWSTG